MEWSDILGYALALLFVGGFGYFLKGKLDEAKLKKSAGKKGGTGSKPKKTSK